MKSATGKALAVIVIVSGGWISQKTLAQESINHRIDTIIIQRCNVFDERNPDVLSPIGKTINALHIKTKEEIIRNELLFHEGDQLEMRLVEESERNLRAKGIIGDVRIHIDTTNENRTIATVETHDKWTLSLFSSFKQDGGHRILSVGIDESNFLGYAQGFNIHLSHNNERTDPYGVELRYTHPHFITDHVSLQIQLKNSDDYHLRTISLNRQFYSDDVRWAGGLYADQGSFKRRRYNDGSEIVTENIPQQNISCWASYSSGDACKIRPSIGYIHSSQSSPDSSMQSTDHLDMVIFSTQVLYRKWIKEYFLNNFGRVEDIPAGYSSSLYYGINLNRDLSSYTTFYGGVQICAAWSHQDGYYFGQNISASRYFLGDGTTESTIRWNMHTYAPLLGAHRLVMRCESIIGYNWPISKQLLLGSRTGLRGYNPYQFTGQRSFMVNVEDRFGLNLEWWIFRFGGSVFFDSGAAWEEKQSFTSQQMHSSVGFGLRIENTKQQGLGILRIEVAYNLDQHHFSQIIFTSQQLFDSFINMDYTLPTILQ